MDSDVFQYRVTEPSLDVKRGYTYVFVCTCIPSAYLRP